MTKARAVEILNELFDSYLKMEKACLDTIIKVDGKQFTLRDKLDEITDEKIALLTAIDALEQDNEWISVKDRLPDKDGKYLVCGDIYLWDIEKYRTNESVVIARYTERKEWLTSLSVKYWMFLPELPKEDNAE